MFVVISTYRAKIGEEDAIIALHENWKDKQELESKAYLSWKLLRKVEAPREFIDITHFENEALARAMMKELQRDAWYLRLQSLVEEGSISTDCQCEWHV
jgi:heme-degrading monooxygenase HmoA